MKKIVALILCLVMTLTLAACAGDGSSNETTGATETTAAQQLDAFCVGYGRVDMEPPLGVSLHGYDKANERLGTSIMDPLYLTCIAFRDAQGTTAMMFTLDCIRTEYSVATAIRREIENKLGVPMDSIFFTTTHSHSTPQIGAMDTQKKAMEAAEAALADLKPAKMFIGTGKTEGLNFVRHYFMDDGSVVGDNYGDPTGKQYVKHVTEVDNEMRLIKFVREGCKDIVMMNWQAHPLLTGGGTKTEISADFVGACRTVIEKELDCQFAYFQGAAGNVDPYSRISSEKVYDGYYQHGKMLAEAAMKALKGNMTEVETGLVKTAAQVYAGEVRKDSGEMIAAGLAFKNVYDAGGTVYEAQKASGGLINSIYTVNGQQTRQSLGATKDINMIALSIGSVGFIGADYEMFDTNGQQIREGSPFDLTFTCCYCNGKNGYIPSAIGYELGCYEMDGGFFVAGTGETLAQEYIKMLQGLK